MSSKASHRVSAQIAVTPTINQSTTNPAEALRENITDILYSRYQSFGFGNKFVSKIENSIYKMIPRVALLQKFKDRGAVA